MNRSEMWGRIEAHPKAWDMVVVGGGATGVGVAIDAASRGYDVLLLEQSDFGKGTSSRSTKLAHGGVRYLEQGDIGLVMEALKERGLLLENAPHLVRDLAFVVPNYDWWEAPFYGLGLKLYELLAGKYGFGSSRILSREETLEHLPTLKTEGLRGGAVYYDGQFDDARLLIHMAATAYEQGAVLLNYVEVTGLTKDSQGFVNGVDARDVETGKGISRRCEGCDQCDRSVQRSAALAGRDRGCADDRSQPGHSFSFRFGVSGGGERDHGSAYQRRTRAVCDSVARAHAGRND